MNNNQKLLLNLLSAAIRSKRPDKIIIKSTELRALFEEANEHHVQALLYPILKSINGIENMDDEVMLLWKKDALLNGIVQTQHIRQITKVLNKFNETGIAVIALKGLVLRELYPRPELRTMTDADILVHKEDIENAKELLLQMGYFEGDNTPMHIRFEHTSHLAIELHWTLTDERYVTNISLFEDHVWENAVPVKICGVSCMMLSPEDQAVHLCLHMVTHIVSSGFGLRQLCDLVLFTESKGNIINWNSFYEKAKVCGIERFVLSIFVVCNKLFGMNIPHVIYCKALKNDRYLDLLINDIFSGGIYGKRNLARMYGNELVHHSGSKDVNYSLSKLKSFLTIFFPPVEKLSTRYAYAKKYFVLTPVAWIHHLICGMLNKNFNLFDKLIFFFSTVPVSRKRSKLLRWLDLQ